MQEKNEQKFFVFFLITALYLAYAAVSYQGRTSLLLHCEASY
jgi:hypothetical protein